MNDRKNKIICDVLVVGAGVAGVCATAAVAREGLRVVIVEKHDFPGGVAENSMNRYVCGLYSNERAEKKGLEDTLNNDITFELVKFLTERYKVKEPDRMGKVFVLPLPDGSLKMFLSGLLDQHENIGKYFMAEAVRVQKNNEHIEQVHVSHKGQILEINCKVVIDCSGDAVVSKLAQAPYQLEEPARIQLSSYSGKVVRLENMDESLMIKVPYFCAKYIASGTLPDSLRFTKFLPGDATGEGMLKMNLPYEKDGFDVRLADKYMNELLNFLREQIPAFADAKRGDSSKYVSDREGARLSGQYVLTQDDVCAARKFKDAVVKAAWPIEIWSPEKGVHYQYIKENDHYEIPKRCLLSQKISNLIAAGKCISVSHEALGSTRVMGPCMSTGEAAGKCAVEIIRR
ncbi:MAG: FAD-dependent oxidoreductase [Candidatus Omnitrophica bacterium]|nr:FAD-dependent oxidoreductase [Candidatus Omnitrophota bacterium]